MIEIILLEWLEFAVRWVHIITAIAWIGSSFYFIALDLGLKKNSSLPYGVTGEEWQVHGGGFYNIQKYSIAPPNLPQDLIKSIDKVLIKDLKMYSKKVLEK